MAVEDMAICVGVSSPTPVLELRSPLSYKFIERKGRINIQSGLRLIQELEQAVLRTHHPGFLMPIPILSIAFAAGLWVCPNMGLMASLDAALEIRDGNRAARGCSRRCTQSERRCLIVPSR